MIVLKEVVDLLSHLGDALLNLSTGLDRTIRRGFVTFDYLAARRARTQLARLHKYGTILGATQQTFRDQVYWYAENPSPASWAEVQKDLSRILGALPHLEAEIESSGSALTLSPVYKDYLTGIMMRRRVLAQLLTMPPPTSDEELQYFRQIGTCYGDLMLRLEQIQLSLEKYIKTNFPEQREWLADVPPHPTGPQVP